MNEILDEKLSVCRVRREKFFIRVVSRGINFRFFLRYFSMNFRLLPSLPSFHPLVLIIPYMYIYVNMYKHFVLYSNVGAQLESSVLKWIW